MLRSKASRWAAAPYLVWMVLFIVVPLGIVVWYALTNSDGQVTLANLTSIGGTPRFLAAACCLRRRPLSSAWCWRSRWGISSAGCAPINSILC